MVRTFLWIAALLGLTASTARADDARLVDFRTDVIAALSRAGCNQGACHGSPNGKNGFRLSLRGFEPDVDLFTLTRGEQGRRVDKQRPENSLFLLKGTGSVPHQGGVRFKAGDPAYETLVRWVKEGCIDAGPAVLEKLEVLPETLRLPSDLNTKQLTVRAHFKKRRGARCDGPGRLQCQHRGSGHRQPRRVRRIQTHRRCGDPRSLSRSDPQRSASVRSHRCQVRFQGADRRQRHRSLRLRETKRTATQPGAACNRRGLPAPRLPRHHRRIADAPTKRASFSIPRTRKSVRS